MKQFRIMILITGDCPRSKALKLMHMGLRITHDTIEEAHQAVNRFEDAARLITWRDEGQVYGAIAVVGLHDAQIYSTAVICSEVPRS
jgi:hypothetical protein